MQEAEQCQVQLHRNAALSHIVLITAQRMAGGSGVPRGGNMLALSPNINLVFFIILKHCLL